MCLLPAHPCLHVRATCNGARLVLTRTLVADHSPVDPATGDHGDESGGHARPGAAAAGAAGQEDRVPHAGPPTEAPRVPGEPVLPLRSCYGHHVPTVSLNREGHYGDLLSSQQLACRGSSAELSACRTHVMQTVCWTKGAQNAQCAQAFPSMSSHQNVLLSPCGSLVWTRVLVWICCRRARQR